MGLISNGTSIFDAGSMSAGIGSSLTFIKKLTASSSSTLSFVDGSGGVNFSTYKEYIFTFKNIHHSNETYFTFNGSTDAGSNYNGTKITTFFSAYHNENGTSGTLEYSTSADMLNSTDFQRLSPTTSTDNDAALSGYLHLFNPSSTTFVKQFIAVTSGGYNTGNEHVNVSGFFNTTSAIDAMQFKPAAGTIDAGDICLYGIS